MDKERYSELFNDVKRWVLASRQQYYIASILTPISESVMADFCFDRKGANNQSPFFLEKAEKSIALTNACALHLGLAIENSTKARKIFDGEILVKNGKPIGLRTDHNILEHVRQCGVILSNDEKVFLERLSYQINSLAKYPIAKKLKNQNNFTGIIVGGNSDDLESVSRIINRILKDKALVSIFNKGKLSEYI